MSFLLPMVLAVLPARADDAALAACCADRGIDCPTELEAIGPGSRADGQRVLGVWRLTCEDGAAHFPHAQRATRWRAEGTILTDSAPGAFTCFQAACALPEGVCLDEQGGAAFVTRCSSDAPPDADAWAAAPSDLTTVVRGTRMVQARVEEPDQRLASTVVPPGPPPRSAARVAQPPRPTTAAPPTRRTDPTPAAIPPTPAPPAVTRSPAPPAVTRAPTVTPPARVAPTPPTPAAVAPSATAPAPSGSGSRVPATPTKAPVPPAARPAPTPSPRPAPSAYVAPSGPRALSDLSIPEAPPQPCRVPDGFYQPSNEQVGLGDEARIQGQIDTALGHYRTAVTLNPCNAFAWHAMGKVFEADAAWEPAETAYAHATRLQPSNHRAWAALGAAREALGDRTGAIEAYQESLTLQPNYILAEDGLRRAVRGRGR